MQELYLGIDTSNYKTSAAVVDGEGRIVCQLSEYLEVPAGKRGLRQSEAFFKHSCRLPDFIREISNQVDMTKIKAVGVSSRPRRVEGSYMPCFLAGINAADEISAVLQVPLYRFSHQEGHSAAVIEVESPIINYRHDDLGSISKALLFHLSGGTTEFLLCSPDEDGYQTEIVGGTLDISIGQLLDRAGVALGLPFPSGAYMDEAAMNYNGAASKLLPRIKLNDGYFNLSGAETKLLRAIESADEADEDFDKSLTKELFVTIAKLLEASATELASAYNVNTVYMVGGVSASKFVRNALSSAKVNILFGRPELSGDNAVGTALLARRKHNR